jgi:hypothetical protein
MSRSLWGRVLMEKSRAAGQTRKFRNGELGHFALRKTEAGCDKNDRIRMIDRMATGLARRAAKATSSVHYDVACRVWSA